MYNEFFSLERAPFRITPDTTLFYSGAKRGAVLDALVYAVQSGEGIVKVVGEVGSGKTMLCRMLEVRLPRNVDIVYIANPSLSPENILQVIAFELKLIVDANVSKLEAMQKLQGLLTRRHAQGKQIVVFIEEAQGMPLATLEEIRLLSNLETEESKLMQVVLFGQPELDSNLSEGSIRQLRERITHSFSLDPLDSDEVSEYLNFRMWVAGYRGPDLFSKRVTKHIAVYSQGMIRRINILADKTLLAAYADNTRTLSKKHVVTAARDSQFDSQSRMTKKWWLGVVAGLILGLAGSGAVFAVLQWQQNQPQSENVPATVPDVEQDQGNADTADEAVALDDESPAVQPERTTQQNSGEEIASAKAVMQESPAAAGEKSVVSIPDLSVSDPEIAPASINYDSEIESWLSSTRSRLTSIGDGGFAIQLLTVSRGSADKLSNYLEKLPSDIDLDKVYVYETEIQGSIKLAVIYNQYSDLNSALEAIDKLPAPLQRWQPFVRTISSIKSELSG